MSAIQWKNGHAVCRVDQLVIGQRVDLQNDLYADPKGRDFTQDGVGSGTDHPEFETEFQVVYDIERETPDCLVVHFDGFSCGFPPHHEVDVDGEQNLSTQAED